MDIEFRVQLALKVIKALFNEQITIKEYAQIMNTLIRRKEMIEL